MIIRITAILLTLVLTMGVMCSCNDTDDDDDRDFLESNEKEDDNDEDEQDSSEEEEESSSKKSTAAPDSNRVMAKDLPNYEFVISKDTPSSIVRIVERISAVSKQKWGTNGEVKTDDYKSPSKNNFEILIGETNRTESKSFVSTLKSGEGGYAIKNNKIVIAGYGEEEMMSALNMFYNSVMLFYPLRKTVFLTSKDNVKQDLSDYVSIMSFNVYVGIESDSAKKANAINLIRTYNPDVFGVQEASAPWQDTLKQEFSGDYHIVGTGRDGNGNGEAMLIFARKSRFNIKSSGTKWLTSTPNVVSKVETSACNRVATYAVIERISDGQIFNYINTHLDHMGGQDEQAGYLCDIISNNTQVMYPTFVSGDFNVFPDSSAVKKMTDNGYSISYEIADKNYSTGAGTLGAKAIIDYLFVKSGRGVDVLTYRVCNEGFYGESSDHFALITVMRF